MTAPTEGERAAFEAGIKFGALYHQFAGAPVSPDSADSLARAMEASIENQPFCADVSVTIDEERVLAAMDGDDADQFEQSEQSDQSAQSDRPERSEAAADGTDVEAAPGDVADYVELTGTLFDATVTVQRRGHEVQAAMETRGDYPQMELRDVQRPE